MEAPAVSGHKGDGDHMTPEEFQAQWIAEEHMDYTPGPNSIDVSPEEPGRVFKEIIRPGIGPERPCNGVEVSVHYIGCLSTGFEFDRSDRGGSPFKFQLGKKSVIGGWEAAVATMTKGEVAKVFIHSELGYGRSGSPPKIPPNATLVFEIELLDWKYEDISVAKDGGITRKTLEAGPSRYYHPNDGATVEISYKGFHEGREFTSAEHVKFILGEGSEAGICRGVEEGLLKVPEGETCVLMLKPKYGYNEQESELHGIPPNAELSFEVTLHHFTKGKEVWSLDGPEKMECAREFKAKGQAFLAEKKHAIAARYFKKIEEFLKMEALLDGAQEEERKDLLTAGHLNAALCYLTLKDYISARQSAEAALELSPNNTKGWYRLGMANLGLNEPVVAKANFLKIMDAEPRLAQQRIAQADGMIKQDALLQKNLYAKMMGLK